MTFQNFQATRSFNNLHRTLEFGVEVESLIEEDIVLEDLIVYAEDFYIEKYADGNFYCIFFNEDIISKDLEVVEKWLFERVTEEN